MKLKSERIKELEHENLDLSRGLNRTRKLLTCAEAAVRDRDEKIAELQEQLDYFKNEYAKVVWNTADYVSFYDRVNTLVEEFEEEQNKPKIMTVDLSNQVDPEVTDFCSFIASIVDKIVSEDNT